MHIVNVIGTETAGDLSRYREGMLSLDIKNGRVIPEGRKPEDVLSEVEDLPFKCCLVLNISAVGTEEGLSPSLLSRLRNAYGKNLFYGGGIRDCSDLDHLASAGFDGVMLATAVHTKAIPHELIRSGCWCS
jgi:phosphoribosylformimino-5-aminoimidazole carboxamide ribotide isomerase